MREGAGGGARYGAGATLISVMAHQVEGGDLGGWVGELNDRLCSVMGTGRFIAGAFAHVSADRDTVSVCVAGTVLPYYLREGTWRVAEVEAMPPLGISHAAQFRSAELDASGAEGFLLMTDGLLELRREDGAVFEDEGFGEMLEALEKKRLRPPAEVVREVRKAFSEAPVYHDDSTVLVVMRDTVPPPECTVDACAEQLGKVRDFVDAWARQGGFSEKETGLAVLGVDEVMTNICRHGLRLRGRAGAVPRRGFGRAFARFGTRGGGDLRRRGARAGSAISSPARIHPAWRAGAGRDRFGFRPRRVRKNARWHLPGAALERGGRSGGSLMSLARIPHKRSTAAAQGAQVDCVAGQILTSTYFNMPSARIPPAPCP